MLTDFISLIYPRNCAGCGEPLLKHEEEICNVCYLDLPKTNFHLQPSNPLKTIFYGRVDLETVSGYYLFQKKGSVQKILHAIKYKGNKELATLIGKWYAEDIAVDAAVMQSDYIIPVPLHPLKYKQRGYNQSEEFAKGLTQGLSIPLNTSLLKRKEFTTTQTRKARFERWENVEDKFEVDPNHRLNGKYVTLVDDVITTGATVEACCLALKEIEGIKINVLSIAYASS